MWNVIPISLSIEAFVEIAKDWKPLKCPYIGNWLNQRGYYEAVSLDTDVAKSLQLLHGKNSLLQNNVYNLVSFA